MNTIQNISFFDYVKGKKIKWNSASSWVIPLELINERDGVMRVINEYGNSTGCWFIAVGFCRKGWNRVK